MGKRLEARKIAMEKARQEARKEKRRERRPKETNSPNGESKIKDGWVDYPEQAYRIGDQYWVTRIINGEFIVNGYITKENWEKKQQGEE